MSSKSEREAAVRALKQQVKKLTESNLEERMPEVRDALAEVERHIAGGGSLADFFESVGQGLIDGQRALDGQSREYARQSPDFAPSVAYRIPRVQAEFAFSLGSVNRRALNVLVYGTSKESQKKQEQKVSFEVVSVPAETSAIPGPLVTNRAVRREVLARLAEYEAPDEPTRHLLKDVLADSTTRDQVLMFLTGGAFSLIILSKPDGEELKADIFRVNLMDNDAPVTQLQEPAALIQTLTDIAVSQSGG